MFNGDINIVNIHTFDLLQKLRKGRSGLIHGSDNILESYENLKVLTMYNKGVPLEYWNVWRPRFDSFKELFTTLNQASGLCYVLLRNYEEINDSIDYSSISDIDILTNDYYLFKRITGAMSYKHKRPTLHPRAEEQRSTADIKKQQIVAGYELFLIFAI